MSGANQDAAVDERTTATSTHDAIEHLRRRPLLDRRRVGSSGGRASAIAADSGDREQVRQLVDTVLERSGRLDIDGGYSA